MEESLSYRKQIKQFTLIAAIIDGILTALLNFTVGKLDAYYTAQNTEPLKQMLFYLPKFIFVLITLSLFFILGKKLTNDNRKAIIFMGAVYFGSELVNLITIWLTAAQDLLTSLGYLTESTILILTTVMPVVTIPFTALAANLAFTVFEGLHPKSKGVCLDDSQMSLSRARSRYVGYELIGGFVVGLITIMPVFVAGILITDSYGADDFEPFLENLTLIATSFGAVASILLMYYAGYKPYKSHSDAMAFLGCSGLGGALGSIFTNILILTENNLFPSSVTELVETTDILGAIGSLTATTAFSAIALAIPIILTVVLMKYFFSQTKITLFGQDS